MLQKTIWTHFLIIGINFLFVFFFVSCGKNTVDYRSDVDLIYINETNHFIKYYALFSSNLKRLLFELPPNSKKIIESRGNGGVPNKIASIQGSLEDFQGYNNRILIKYNDEKCIVYLKREGPTTHNVSFYETREIERGYYEAIYRFTETAYNQAKNCE